MMASPIERERSTIRDKGITTFANNTRCVTLLAAQPCPQSDAGALTPDDACLHACGSTSAAAVVCCGAAGLDVCSFTLDDGGRSSEMHKGEE